jgi:hypothetical protein
MDDRHIEETLRKSWSPSTPEGMRERVLRRTREELARGRAGWRPWILNWKPALAALAVFVIMFANVSDFLRQSRLDAMMDGVSTQMTPVQMESLRSKRRAIEDLLAFNTTRAMAGKRTMEGTSDVEL